MRVPRQSQGFTSLNYLEATYPTHLAPAGAASQTGAGYYYRYYPTTNSYIATNGDGNVYYYSNSMGLAPIGGEASWLSTAGQANY